MLITRRTAVGGLLAASVIRPAFAAPEKITYLFPAPPFLPAFMPFHIAMKRGYYTANNVEVTFQTGRGGVMPAWVDRLDPATIKSLAVYVHSLGGGK